VATKTICIASGKGGVGKTTLSINLAMALVESGNKVLYFDADMGLANAQIGLGSESMLNLSHVVNDLVTLPEIVIKTRFGIDLISGASGIAELAAIGTLESASIIQSFSSLPESYDFLIVDCAAGISPSVLSFLHGCQHRVIVGTTDLSSIADAYALIKVLVTDYRLEDLVYLPNLVENQRQGRKLFDSMNTVAQNFLATQLTYLGSIVKDPLVNSSWRKSMPFIKMAPTSLMSSCIRNVAAGLAEQRGQPFNGSGVQFFMERA
jgi:flagellar biosynthesis protein FlhG